MSDALSNTLRSTEDLLRELENERLARCRADNELIRQKKIAHALNRLCTALAAEGGLDQLLRDLIEIYIDATEVDVAVIRVREGDFLRSRAAVGLEEEVAAGFTVPIEQGLFGRIVSERGPVHIRAAAADPINRSDYIRQKNVQSLYGLGLYDEDEILGVLFIGSLADREFTEDEKNLLNVLAIRATSAIVSARAREQLRESIRKRDDVLAVVTHDLRNPISIISMAAHSLLKRLPDSFTRRPVERIVRGAQRADRLIRDLLEVTEIEGGRLALDLRQLDTADVILAALESQQNLAAGASIIIAPDLSPDLPPIKGDEERLLEVLENLIGNAVKFTPPGGRIVVGAAPSQDQVVVTVKDTGVGIAPDELPHLFDRFWQARRADRRGTGLGLTICKGIIETHGGTIWAESTPGAGTTMSFTLPVDGSPGARDYKERAVSDILIVDDRPENLLSLKAILDIPEYRLVTASSGEEALKLALRTRFAVALIDIAMPGMNGLEVAVHLKELERSKDIPIIFITAYGDDPKEIHRAYSAGGADYLVKPLDPEIVRKKVAVFIALSRKRQINGLLQKDRTQQSWGDFDADDTSS